MSSTSLGLGFTVILLLLMTGVNGLKCRTGEETQPNEDFEYVVRMCLRQLKNNSSYQSHQENFDRNFQNMFELNRNKDRNRNNGNSNGNNNRNENNNNNNNNNNYNGNNNNRNYNYRNRGDRSGNDGFEYFWGPNGNSGRDRERNKDRGRDQNDRDKMMDNDYMEDSDYFHSNPLRGMNGENGGRIRPRPPHTFQQQVQHDRDVPYGYSYRDTSYGYQNGERKKNSKRMSHHEQKGDSPLEQLDPCMVHCIFQEMQMLDENGKPDKRTVSDKMSQKIRNPELKAFIQDSVEECFDDVDEEADNNNSNNRNRGDNMCIWAKNFAICLEERGKEACDDWNEPVVRNKGKDEQKNKNKGGKTGNSRG